MELQVYLLILMSAVTLAAFTSAVNSRGTSRVVLSYILASLALILTVFCVMKYMSDQELAVKEAEKVKYEEQLRLAELQRQAEEEARLASGQAADVEGEKKCKAELVSITGSGSSIARTILSVDVENENADYDGLLARSAGLKGQAFELKRKLGELQIPAGSAKLTEAKQVVEKALQNLTVAANYFNLYFKAEDEDEEDERYDLYKQNAKAAVSNFNKASEQLSKE